MFLSALSVNNIYGWCRLKFKNKKGMKYRKTIVVMIYKTEANKNNLFYKYDDRSCENTFIY